MSQTKNYKTEGFEIILQIQLTTLFKNDECNLENTNPHEKKGNFKMLKVHTADTLISQTNLNAYLLFVLIPIDKCSFQVSSRNLLFAAETITETHNKSKCSVVVPNPN